MVGPRSLGDGLTLELSGVPQVHADAVAAVIAREVGVPVFAKGDLVIASAESHAGALPPAAQDIALSRHPFLVSR